ncbi:unnamed protein product [Strongylus vulgaris]|uniref:Uncharacterized protein n=1 Tax=Strongylus vulgaris TaxID=40348 RepID=A0A3P7J3Y3_STRVU|nr:unnamed protein product [Strongylus vulgaris]
MATAVIEGYKNCHYPPGIEFNPKWKDMVEDRVGTRVLIMATTVIEGYKYCHYPPGIEFDKNLKTAVEYRIGTGVPLNRSKGVAFDPPNMAHYINKGTATMYGCNSGPARDGTTRNWLLCLYKK